MTDIQVTQLTKLQVSAAVLKQQQLCAAAVIEAASNGLQQHAARLHVTTAVHCSRFQCTVHLSAQAAFVGMIPAMQQESNSCGSFSFPHVTSTCTKQQHIRL
jgi:hypothetical protein